MQRDLELRMGGATEPIAFAVLWFFSPNICQQNRRSSLNPPNFIKAKRLAGALQLPPIP
jgi:hypothetical protein